MNTKNINWGPEETSDDYEAEFCKLDDSKKYMELLKICKHKNTFIFDNLLIAGNRGYVICKFLNEKPSDKFRTWLFNTNRVIRILDNEK